MSANVFAQCEKLTGSVKESGGMQTSCTAENSLFRAKDIR
jgi:hypothetical protein